MFKFLLIFLLLSTGLFAADLTAPRMAKVQNVALGDVLNIRAFPSPMSRKIGAFALDAKNITVNQFNEAGTWARVNVNGDQGWVRTKFLAIDAPSTLKTVTLKCHGNEPFWSVKVSATKVVLTTPGDSAPVSETHRLASISPSIGKAVFGKTTMQLNWSQNSAMTTAKITPQACQDDMSDYYYPMSYLDSNGLKGCCTIMR